MPGRDQPPPHPVVEEISAFDSLYGWRFPFTRRRVAALSYEDCYRTNLHQVRALGAQVTHNDFQAGWRLPISSWTGPAERGRLQELHFQRGFIPVGYQYLRVQLEPVVGYFQAGLSG